MSGFVGKLLIKVDRVESIGLVHLLLVHLCSRMNLTKEGMERSETYHVGLECWFIFALQELLPVNAVEKGVRLDLGGAIDSQSLGRVSIQKLG